MLEGPARAGPAPCHEQTPLGGAHPGLTLSRECSTHMGSKLVFLRGRAETTSTYLAALPRVGWGGRRGGLVLLVHWDHGVPVFWQQREFRSLGDGIRLDPMWGHWLSPSSGWEWQMPSG